MEKKGAVLEKRAILREVFLTRLGLLLMIMVAVGIGALFWASELRAGGWKNFFFAVGTGLMSSAVLTFAQQLITSRASTAALAAALAEQVELSFRALRDEYRGLNEQYFPTNIFEPSRLPDPSFNQALMEDLVESREFLFRGVSARHTAVRLAACPRHSWEVRVIIADPRDRDSLTNRAQYIQIQEGMPAKTEDEVMDQLIADIHMGIVGLYLARAKCTKIEIVCASAPAIDRFEILDNAIWITLYSNVTGRPAVYPKTIRFAAKSFIYTMERRDFLRVHDANNTRKVVIFPNTHEQEFAQKFEEITGCTLTSQKMAEIAGRFASFKDEFIRHADLT